jgi:autotransporter strand-loop-strand O-heptosyltransferase
VDEYKTTEERLIGYGLQSDKIEVIHFEPKENMLMRLKSSFVFLSCSRAEGWNLPLIEAMACGIPAVALKWSGSMEYSSGAVLVEVAEFKKPEHVYGMPDCPGLWAEPDFEHFKTVIKDAYDNWAKYREKALKASEYIRTEFSWDKAAAKAMLILEEIKATKEQLVAKTDRQIFVIGCWPNSEEKMNTLIETITQIQAAGFPVLITSHYPLPPAIVELADYYIFDKNNVLSGDWRATYFRDNNGTREFTKATIPYHAVACLHAMRNAIDFLANKPEYDVMHYMEYDVEFDVQEYLALWELKPKNKQMLGISYEKERGKASMHTLLWSGNIEWLSLWFPIVKTWDDYLNRYGENLYVLEEWIVQHFQDAGVLQDITMHDYQVENRFNQIDTEAWRDDVFNMNFTNGPVLTIQGWSRREYEVAYENPEDGVQYKKVQRVGTWTSPATKFYRDWLIKAALDGEVRFEHRMDLKGKNVIISMGSKALGDTIAWTPYFDEFRKKHDCHVIASGWWNELFDYPEIEWTKPGTAHKDVYAVYEVGCFDGDKFKNPRDWRTVRMQEIATDILGLEFKELKPRMKQGPAFHYDKPHICFSEHSTMKAKLWNREGGWQTVIDYLNGLGYKCVSISKEPTGLKDVVARNGRPMEETIATMRGADFYIGLGAGPSWLAWALDLPVVMISGFSEPWCEYINPFRIYSPNGCGGCFNDTSVKFDRGWEWCGRKKDFICTKEITPEMVIEKIEDVITRP